MARIGIDREGCSDDYVFTPEPEGESAWITAGSHLIYIRLDEDGTLTVTASPASDLDALYGEIISPAP